MWLDLTKPGFHTNLTWIYNSKQKYAISFKFLPAVYEHMTKLCENSRSKP